MAELTKIQLSILQTLNGQAGPIPISMIADGHGESGTAEIEQLCQMGMVTRTGAACAISDIGRAALVPVTEAAQMARQPANPGTRRALFLKRLSTQKGRTVAQLAQIMGWLPHTTRAALTRLRQAGYRVERVPAQKGNKPSRYRLAQEA